MPRPEGYRKALRLMKLAEKFGLPLFTFVDTPGAYPGHRRRGARAVGSDRPQPLRDGRAAHADHRDGHRRRRLRRRARDRDRRRHADAAVRDLLGDLARRLRVDPLEVRRARARGRRNARHHGAAAEAARPDRQGHQRAAGRRAPRPRGDDGDAEEGARRGAAPAAASSRSTRCSKRARTRSSPMASSRRSPAG